jgi:hypothetical protein
MTPEELRHICQNLSKTVKHVNLLKEHLNLKLSKLQEEHTKLLQLVYTNFKDENFKDELNINNSYHVHDYSDDEVQNILEEYDAYTEYEDEYNYDDECEDDNVDLLILYKNGKFDFNGCIFFAVYMFVSVLPVFFFAKIDDEYQKS